MEEDNINGMFRELDIIEIFFNKSYITLEEYLKIKSSIIDHWRGIDQKDLTEDLPF